MERNNLKELMKGYSRGERKDHFVSCRKAETMLDFYQNLNINTGILQDPCSDKNSLGCGQAGKKMQNMWPKWLLKAANDVNKLFKVSVVNLQQRFFSAAKLKRAKFSN